MSANMLGGNKYIKRGKVLKIRGKAHLHRRFAAMGLVVGSTIKVVRLNTNIDDIEVSLNGRSFRLRENELAQISVKSV